MDINTPEGMAAAKEWTESFLSQLNEGGVWGIPRSNSGYVFSFENMTATCIAGGEPIVEKVLAELGYRVIGGVIEHPTESEGGEL